MDRHRLHLDSPIGILVLESDDAALKSVSFVDNRGEDTENPPSILTDTAAQLREYFEGTRKDFDLRMDPDGTEFQKSVWKKLLEVPYGTTKSYRDIALSLGSHLNTRAVGTANGRNPLAVIVPCHRIIGSNGKMTGYAGGLERKKWLLLHESCDNREGLLF